MVEKEVFYRELDKYYEAKPQKKPFKYAEIEKIIVEIRTAKTKM